MDVDEDVSDSCVVKSARGADVWLYTARPWHAPGLLARHMFECVIDGGGARETPRRRVERRTSAVAMQTRDGDSERGPEQSARDKDGPVTPSYG